SHIITWYLELWEAQSQTIFSASRSLRLIYSAGLFKRHVKQLIFLGFFYLISQKPKIIWLLTMATSPVTVKRPAFLFVPLSPDGTAESKKMGDGWAWKSNTGEGKTGIIFPEAGDNLPQFTQQTDGNLGIVRQIRSRQSYR